MPTNTIRAPVRHSLSSMATRRAVCRSQRSKRSRMARYCFWISARACQRCVSRPGPSCAPQLATAGKARASAASSRCRRPKHLAEGQPGGPVALDRDHGDEGLPVFRLGRAQGLDPGQLLDQVAGKRPLRLVEQLGQLACRDDPRRAQAQTAPVGFVNENLQQSSAGAAPGSTSTTFSRSSCPAAARCSMR